MFRTSAPSPAHVSPFRSLAPALALAALVTLARALYLAFVCDYQLVEDEAHYWLWSRYLDWSYYSKGPGVAVVIAASTRLFGNAEWCVRLPTALLSGLGLVAVAVMLHSMARASTASTSTGASAAPGRVAFAAVLALLLAPALQVVGVLMTIDGPYVACWALACLGAWLALGRGVRHAWLLVGFGIAAGFLFKYTVLLLIPGLIAYVFSSPGARAACRTQARWLLLGIAIASLGLAPVLIWNSQQGWPTFKHLLGHLGMQGGDVPLGPGAPRDEWSPFWSLELVGQQLAMIGPLLILGVWSALHTWRHRPVALSSSHPSAVRFNAEWLLICCAAPILLFYLVVSFITEPEGNWPMAAYVTLLPLGAWHAADALARARDARAAGQPRPIAGRGVRRLWRAGLWYGVIAAFLVHFAGDVAAILNRLSQTSPFRSAFTSIVGREPRPIVLGRLYGAREMAADVHSQLESIRAPGGPAPFVLAQHYGRASQMAYYLPQPAPDVLCAMPQTGGRKSQFDLWPHTSLARPDLLGRSAIILSNNRPETFKVWQGMFERVVPIPGERLAGEHKPDRFAFIATRYRGLAVSAAPASPSPAQSSKDAP